MTDAEKLSKLKEIVKDSDMDLDLSSVTAETKLDSLEVDSIEFLELVLQIEDNFDVSIDDEDASKVKTVQDLLNLI